MGKIITINGANFSENACDVVEMFNHSIEDWDEYFSLKTNNYISKVQRLSKGINK